MFLFNLKSSVAIALICFVSGCCMSFLLLDGCSGQIKNRNTASPKDLQKQVNKVKLFYQSQITALETQNQQLQKDLTSAKAQLEAIKLRSKTKAAAIKKRIEPNGYPAKELLKKADTSFIRNASIISPCDSLVQEVSDFMRDTEIKDSLYELQRTIQDSLLAGKDAVILIQKEQLESLSKLVDKAIEVQQLLFSENIQLRKRVKRQKLKGKLISIGAMILVGLTTNYILHH